MKAKGKKKESEVSKQQKKHGFQRSCPVKKLDWPSRLKPTIDNSNITSVESFRFDVSSEIDFMYSTKVLENRDIECIFFNGKFF